MKQLIRVNNKELSFRLKLNYNTVYSQMKMLLDAGSFIFADLSTKSVNTTWYSNDDAEYVRLTDVPENERRQIMSRLKAVVNQVAQMLRNAQEMAPYVDDIMEIPDLSFVFYKKENENYRFLLAGWGCKYAHAVNGDRTMGIYRGANRLPVPEDPGKSQNTTSQSGSEKTDASDSVSRLVTGMSGSGGGDHLDEQLKPGYNIIEKIDDGTTGTISGTTGDESKVVTEDTAHIPEEDSVKKKMQHVWLRVLDQHEHAVGGERVEIRMSGMSVMKLTGEDGKAEVGDLPCRDTFTVSFPDMKGVDERGFEVEPNVEVYDAYVKKLVRYAPVLFVEDQDGNPVRKHDIKVIVAGQETVYNTGEEGVVQLPFMQEGQKFIAVDTANYANTEEFDITPAKAKTPYYFCIRQFVKSKVGITVLDKDRKPVPRTVVDVKSDDKPCRQVTGNDGRAEFPHDVFHAGKMLLGIQSPGKQRVLYELDFKPETTEYAVQLKEKRLSPSFGRYWKWLGLLPLLALLAWGGYELYQYLHKDEIPSWAELNKGVVLLRSDVVYHVDTGLAEKTGFSDFYFNYNENEKTIFNFTFDVNKAVFDSGWGTGFFISEDGLIATNRHVAAPIPPEEVVPMLKDLFVSMRDIYSDKAQKFQKELNQYGSYRMLSKENALILDQRQDSLDYYTQAAKFYDRIVDLANYKVEVICRTYAAFDNSMIGHTVNEQTFHPCTCLAYGEPGDVSSNDLAVIQLNEKEKIMPKDAYIFEIPDTDPFADNKEGNEDYEIWVLGYNNGPALAGMKTGIHPQHVNGSILSTNEKYRVGYNAGIMGGTSGGPVVNKERKLVAINNSGLRGSNLNFGVRTTFLRELLEEVNEKRNVTQNNTEKK